MQNTASHYWRFSKAALMAAMEEIEAKTCVRFQHPRKNNDNYIFFKQADGCWSLVGRHGTRLAHIHSIDSNIFLEVALRPFDRHWAVVKELITLLIIPNNLNNMSFDFWGFFGSKIWEQDLSGRKTSKMAYSELRVKLFHAQEDKISYRYRWFLRW